MQLISRLSVACVEIHHYSRGSASSPRIEQTKSEKQWFGTSHTFVQQPGIRLDARRDIVFIDLERDSLQCWRHLGQGWTECTIMKC